METNSVLDQIEKYKKEDKPVIIIGVDTHKDFNLAVAKEISLTGETVSRRLSYKSSAVLKFINELEEQFKQKALVVVGYESGPTGKNLCRDITRAGYICQVIPAHKPTGFRENKRIKTDRRDAMAIVACLIQQDFTPVYVTAPQEEDVSLYIRMRDDTNNALRRTKQQIKSFILQKGKRFKDKSKGGVWSDAYLQWLKSVKLSEAARETLNEYLAQYFFLNEKLKQFDRKIRKTAQSKRYRDRVQMLRCFAGVDCLVALSFICEIGDFNRFETAGKFAAFIGLVPGENSSGSHQFKTGITKTGNKHLRKLAVLAAQGVVRSKSAKSQYLMKKQEGCSPELIAYADRCQSRLKNKFSHLIHHSGKQRNVAITAVARELCCFIWGAMTGKIA